MPLLADSRTRAQQRLRGSGAKQEGQKLPTIPMHLVQNGIWILLSGGALVSKVMPWAMEVVVRAGQGWHHRMCTEGGVLDGMPDVPVPLE